jgi:hypothetical protein
LAGIFTVLDRQRENIRPGGLTEDVVAIGNAFPYVSDKSREGVMGQVEGKVALVTGSGRNIGRATVLHLAREGAHDIVNARANQAEADSVVREAQALGRGDGSDRGSCSLLGDHRRQSSDGP